MKHLLYFESESLFNTKRNNDYIEPWISYTLNKGLDYNIDWRNEPFTVEALQNGQITWGLSSGEYIYYSKNGGEWTTFNNSTTLSVNTGDKVRFKGTLTNYYGKNLSSTGRFNIKGNILSLLTGDNYISSDVANILPANAFRDMFTSCTTIISAKELKLPKNSATGYCYCYMFGGCSNLVDAPELPATVLNNGSRQYNGMFSGCTSLITAPELPATILGSEQSYRNMFQGCTSLINAPSILPAMSLNYSCYNGMFENCTSLEVAPELPATSLFEKCYGAMFYGCSNLKYIKAMFLDSPTGCTNNWVYGVSNTGTFIKNSQANWNVTGVDGIPTGWTVQTV